MAPARVRFADEAVSLRVKNTFIDDIEEPLGAEAGAEAQEQPSVRRSTTAPLLRHKILELEVEEEDGSESTFSGGGPLPADSDDEGPQPMLWPKTMSADDLEAMLETLEAEEAEA